jgi:hypothetical protein
MRFHRENKTPCLDGENTVFHRVFASPRIHGSLKNFAIFGRASTRNSKLLNDLAGIFACFAGVKDRVVLAMQLTLSIAVLQRAVRKDGAEKPERTGKHRPPLVAARLREDRSFTVVAQKRPRGPLFHSRGLVAAQMQPRHGTGHGAEERPGRTACNNSSEG